MIETKELETTTIRVSENLQRNVNSCGWKFVLQVPANSTEALGVMVLKYRGIFPEARFYWIGVVALIGYILLLNLFFTLALQYLDRKYLAI